MEDNSRLRSNLLTFVGGGDGFIWLLGCQPKFVRVFFDYSSYESSAKKLFDLREYSRLDLFIFAAVLSGAHGLIGLFGRRPFRKNHWAVFCGFVSGAIGGALLYAVIYKVFGAHTRQPYLVATLAPPLMLLAFVGAAYSEVAVLGIRASE